MATHRVLIRVFGLAFLSVLSANPAVAARHEVKLQVLTTLSQNVRGVGIARGEEVTSAPVSCSPPYPDNTVSVQQQVPGYPSGDQCTLATPAHDVLGAVHNREVQALLTTEDGKQYYVILGCQKQYGWCDPLADKAVYSGKLNDNPKWLANYRHRPVTSFVKISFWPSGKKKVTYRIEYAARVTGTNLDGVRPEASPPLSRSK